MSTTLALAQPRIVKDLHGGNPPQTTSVKVGYILSDCNYGKINLRSSYQRDIRWTLKEMSALIGTVMKNGVVPELIMYEYHDGDEEAQAGTYEQEVIDGQHRLFSLRAFMESKEIQITSRIKNIKKSFIPYWLYETEADGNKRTEYVFYKETEDVENWCKKQNPSISPSYLTPDEIKRFEKFTISIKTINNKLSLDERRAIFLDLQKGVSVRNADSLKNMTECELMAKFEQNGYEKMMSEVFFVRCSRNVTNFWTQWAARCYLLFVRSKKDNSASDVKPPSDVFLTDDTQIKKDIETNQSKFNPTPEQFNEFNDKFHYFMDFLKRQEDGVVFNPTQMFTLFYYLCCGLRDFDILKSHMRTYSKNGQVKAYKNLWKSQTREPRRQYFNTCLSELESMVALVPNDPHRTRPNISKKIYKQTFDKRRAEGTCAICEETEITEDNFEAGHIVAFKMSGSNKLDNLLPMCFDCNRGMGTRNALEYKKDVYPHTCV